MGLFLLKKEIMKIKVTEQGLVIPKEWLKGIDEVEIRQENNMIIVIATSQQDSIWDLGKNPVSCDIKDGSVNHDHYLYTNNE